MNKQKLYTTSADELIQIIEERGLGWDVGNTGNFTECRIWEWPHVVSRYRPQHTESLAHMLAEAMYQVDWTKYPEKK